MTVPGASRKVVPCPLRRRLNVRRWSPIAAAISSPAVRPNSEHARMFYPLVLRDRGISRDRLVDHLENHAIETRQLLPLINQPIYRQMFGVLDDRYPVAAHLNRHAFYIGCHPEMTDDDTEYVIDQFKEYFGDRT